MSPGRLLEEVAAKYKRREVIKCLHMALLLKMETLNDQNETAIELNFNIVV